jgi:glucokinase
MGKFCVGIDLGGTFIKSALLGKDMAIRAELRSPTPVEAGADGVIETMASDAERLIRQAGCSREDIAGVGVGSPGPLDLEAGVVIGTPNIPGFENVPLRQRLSRLLNRPVVLENDANAAALGEYLVGSGRDVAMMVLLTLGTGIGSGIVIDGRLLHGVHGIGAEVGHMIVDPGGEKCGCGQHGCLERYASATYLARHARQLIERDGRSGALAEVLKKNGDVTSLDVEAARRAGDALAEEVWDRAVRFLAIGCVNLCRVLDPDVIVLGGGMAKAGEELMQPLRRHFRREHWELAEPKTALALAQVGNDAGVMWRAFGE